METYETDKQLEIARLEDSEKGNYKVAWGNPLTGEPEKEVYAQMLKLNDFAISASNFSIGEYNESITIEVTESMVNIVVENSDSNNL